ncbi:MAG: hypothetical protein HKN16_11040 [Saprospiraceae bacterium]|nr:hypothetical protein [Saprospiraceae bacterium]
MKALFTLLFLSICVISFSQDGGTSDPDYGKYIKFKIVNKTLQFAEAYVEGPNARGGTFSYGLDLGPFIPRKENWSIGTKLYVVNKQGTRHLVHTVTAKDEGKIVDVSPSKAR